MIRRPPRTPPTDSLLPYTTLFRADAFGVEAIGRLVQEQPARIAEQGLGKAEPLAHALGIVAHPPRGSVGKPYAFQHQRALALGHALERGEELPRQIGRASCRERVGQYVEI